MFQRFVGDIAPGVVLAAAGALACAGEQRAPDEHPPESRLVASLKPTKEQLRIIDSVIASAPSVETLARADGGWRYDVADAALTAAVRREAMKTNDCYTNALRDYDPHLAGKVTVLVNFGAAGWDLIRVEDDTWTGPAGGIVESCINYRAKNEWALPTSNVKIGAHLVQLEFRPDSVAPSPPKLKRATKSKQ